MVWNKVPYTNFHELNQDWIIRVFTEFQQQMDNIVALSTIKYADPFQWDITRQYEKNTLVIDAITGTAYLSLQPVPAGIGLDNADYWTAVLDLNRFIAGVRESITANVESNTTTATHDYTEGSLLWVDQTLYEAKTAITAGDTFTIGGNVIVITVEDILARFKTYIENMAQDLSHYKDGIDQDLADYKDGVDQDLADYKDGVDHDLADYKDGVNHDLADYKDGVDSEIQTFETNITTLVNNTVSELAGKIKGIIDTNKGILYIGDSWTVGNGVDPARRFSSLVCQIMGMTEINYGVGGAGFIRKAGGTGEKFIETLERAAEDHGEADTGLIVVMGGYNDINHGHSPTDLYAAAVAFYVRLGQLFPQVPVLWMGFNQACYGITTNFRQGMDYVTNAPLVSDTFANIIRYNNKWQWALTGKPQYYIGDFVHPNEAGHRIIAKQIVASIYGAGPEYILESDTITLNDNTTYMDEFPSLNLIQKGDEIHAIVTGAFHARGSTWNATIAVGSVPPLFRPTNIVSVPCFLTAETDANISLAIFTDGTVYLKTLKANTGSITSGSRVYPSSMVYQATFPQP